MGATEAPTPPKQRLDSVDLLRGLVMVIMALDHVRDYFTSAHFEPTDLTRTTAPLFFTRWITHFCAPVFVFLAGTGAYLSASRGKPKRELARFLVTRGLWLVLLEVTWVRFGWMFNLDYQLVGLQVIWAIGWSMVALAALIFLPVRIVGALGLLMIATHNLLDGIHADALGRAAPVWRVAHEMGMTDLPGNHHVFVAYPLVPWVGVMAAGYAFGELLRVDQATRRRRLLLVGTFVVVLFVVLRAINVYGDPHPWSRQAGGAIYDVMAFLNCEKYPPSLLYLAMTLGPAILALAALEHLRGAFARALLVFGRVPLFYYLLHIPLIHLAAIVSSYTGPGKGAFPGGPWGSENSDGFGYALPGVYLVWAIIVVMLYPLCRWFAALKARRHDAWLSYL
jgi:uncharacterized membrane protein